MQIVYFQVPKTCFKIRLCICTIYIFPFSILLRVKRNIEIVSIIWWDKKINKISPRHAKTFQFIRIQTSSIVHLPSFRKGIFERADRIIPPTRMHNFLSGNFHVNRALRRLFGAAATAKVQRSGEVHCTLVARCH